MISYNSKHTTYWVKTGKMRSEEYFLNGHLNRTDGPAHIEYYEDGQVESETWYLNAGRERYDNPDNELPTRIMYYDNGSVLLRTWFVNDKIHRENGPAVIAYDPDGTIVEESYFIHGRNPVEEIME